MNLKSLNQKLEHLLEHTPEVTASASGQLIRVVGLTLEARGCSASLGSLCSVESDDGAIISEVIGFDDDIIYLMAIDEIKNLTAGARVTPLKQKQDLQ
jgi:flagellum-specific ATP synthase